MADRPGLDAIVLELATRYEKDKNLQGSWKFEGAVLASLLPELRDQISFNYDLTGVLGVGGSGIVFRCNDRNLGVQRALKISRPSPGKEVLLAEILIAETRHLAQLVHQNLIRVFAKGSLQHAELELPYYVMDFVAGAKDADKFLEGESRTEADLLRILSGLVDALSYMHEQDEIHMDVKPGNVLVTPEGRALLSDLGFAKRLTTSSGLTLIGGTDGYIHPEAKSFVTEAASDKNRLRGQVDRSILEKRWDLYPLGRTFFELLAAFRRPDSARISLYTLRYLRLMAARLLDGKLQEEDRALGLSIDALRELRYCSMREVSEDLSKLLGTYNLSGRVPELNAQLADSVQASAIVSVPLTERTKCLLQQPVVMRLGNCTQLGMLNLVYPTALHSRLEHSLGTFGIAARVIVALYFDPLNPLFRQVMGDVDLKALLLASLLHDIGQYPLAHDLEEAAPEFFSHLRMGQGILSSPPDELRRVVEEDASWGVPLSRIREILEADPDIGHGSLKDGILHSIIDGPIDADKLDYLTRDGRHLGLAYGAAIDFERLLRTLTVVIRGRVAAMGLHEKGKVPAETVAFVRYVMFGQVYWHHAYRAIKAMLHRSVWEMLFLASDKKREELRSEFQNFVSGGVPQAQVALFGGQEESPYLGSQIHFADLAVLRWISSRTSPSGARLVRGLRERQLFKRLLVLTRERGEDKRLWDDIAAFYRANSQRWQAKLELQRHFQEGIGRALEAKSLPATPEAIDLRERLANEVVLLVDFPPERDSSKTRLEYLVEAERWEAKTDDLRTGGLEESNIWKALRDGMHESIGKVRVFCAGDLRRQLYSALTRSEIEKELVTALKRSGKWTQ